MRFRLGIDAGGTYTDAALVDGRDRVVHQAKALTTHDDLAIGIDHVLSMLPEALLERVELASLATTLATNAVVEGRGAPVLVLLAGYSTTQIARAGLAAESPNCIVGAIDGGHDAAGNELRPLDLAHAGVLLDSWRGDVAAVAVSSMFSVRNPAHELALRDLVRTRSRLPVTCGHELADALNAPRRAATAALNARLVPYLQRLIGAVSECLDRRGVEAPLMIVKGDGSMVNMATALERPVEVVLSGPAASMIGAQRLAALDTALVADMGGTTTDISVLRGGIPETTVDGARIGTWKPMVPSLRIWSIGLGGDSEARFSGGVGIAVGPRRIMPLSLVCLRHPHLRERLRRHLELPVNPRLGRFVLPLDAHPATIARLDSDERTAWQRLVEGPLELEALTSTERRTARAVARLQRRGLAIYSGFTPTDAAHVLGLSNHWDAAAAHDAAVLWGRQLRRIYGYGDWNEDDARGPSVAVVRQVGAHIVSALVRAGLAQDDLEQAADNDDLSSLVATMIDARGATGSRVFSVRFSASMPLVAVGAPAATFYPEVAARLGCELVLPEHGAVAGAVGAVSASVIRRCTVTVTSPVQGRFRVHGPAGTLDFDDLESAIEAARAIAGDAARRQAGEWGASEPVVSVVRTDSIVGDGGGKSVFFGSTVVATATGRPSLNGS